MSKPEVRRALHLLDLVCLIVGFGMASLWVRAFWRAPDVLPVVWLPLMGLLYAWLGLAMSGPIVFLLERRPARPPESGEADTGPRFASSSPRENSGSRKVPVDRTGGPPSTVPPARRRTAAEIAWLAIGAYWIGMTLIVVPSRVHDTPLSFIAVFQIVAALALWVIPRRPILEVGQGASWTHHAAIVVLVTWPIAWVAMILLSRAIA